MLSKQCPSTWGWTSRIFLRHWYPFWKSSFLITNQAQSHSILWWVVSLHNIQYFAWARISCWGQLIFKGNRWRSGGSFNFLVSLETAEHKSPLRFNQTLVRDVWTVQSSSVSTSQLSPSPCRFTQTQLTDWSSLSFWKRRSARSSPFHTVIFANFWESTCRECWRHHVRRKVVSGWLDFRIR